MKRLAPDAQSLGAPCRFCSCRRELGDPPEQERHGVFCAGVLVAKFARLLFPEKV